MASPRACLRTGAWLIPSLAPLENSSFYIEWLWHCHLSIGLSDTHHPCRSCEDSLYNSPDFRGYASVCKGFIQEELTFSVKSSTVDYSCFPPKNVLECSWIWDSTFCMNPDCSQYMWLLLVFFHWVSCLWTTWARTHCLYSHLGHLLRLPRDSVVRRTLIAMTDGDNPNRYPEGSIFMDRTEWRHKVAALVF